MLKFYVNPRIQWKPNQILKNNYLTKKELPPKKLCIKYTIIHNTNVTTGRDPLPACYIYNINKYVYI
jgi:hypothetical protein